MIPPAQRPPCVAPSWPEWAIGGDGEVVWVRADIDPATIIEAAWGWKPDDLELIPFREPGSLERMWLDLEPDGDEDGEWMLRTAHRDQHDEVVVYARWDFG